MQFCMAFFFVPRMVRHEGSKALRNTKARRHKETRRIGAEVLPRMHECGNGFLWRMFCHECTNVGMILVLKTLQHLIYQLHIYLYASNNHLLIYLLYQSLQNFSWTTFCKFCSTVINHRLNTLCPSNRPRELCN